MAGDMNEISGIGPGMVRVLAVMAFAAGLCFAVGSLCDLASIWAPRRREPW